MKYVFLAAFALAIFGLCFLVDLLLKKLTPDDPRKRTGKVVRPPRRGSIFGVLLLFFGFSAILFYSNRMEPIWIVLCALCMDLADIYAGSGALMAAVIVWNRYHAVCRRRFGGITGDTSGFFVQMLELAMMAGMFLGQAVEISGFILWRSF